MGQDLKKKAADRILDLKEARDEAQKRVEELEEKVAELERRQKAEEVILEARDCEDAPDHMKVASIDRFLALRAKFEEKDQEEFQKVATTVAMWNDEDGGIMPSELPDSDDSGDFNEWIKDKVSQGV